MANRKPRIIISSTIHDFRDLRSALRHWLQELGYDVQLSEYNDFVKDLDQNSYDACLDAVRRSDIYILLVGSRVGGWFNKHEQISITRAEYQAAYEEFMNKRIQMALFVRREVWDIREDRRSLARYLEHEQKINLEPHLNRGILNHRSSHVNDAESIFSFLTEIARTDDMKNSLSDPTAERPRGNWVHTFTDFRDITDALKPVLVGPVDIGQAVAAENIKLELQDIFISLLEKHNGKIRPSFTFLSELRKSLRITLDDVVKKMHTLSDADRSRLFYWLTSKLGTVISPTIGAVSRAVAEGIYCSYDRTRGVMVAGELHHALRNFEALHSRCIELSAGGSFDLLTAVTRSPATVKMSDLAREFALHDVHSNIFTLGLYIYSALKTHIYDAPLPDLLSRSPIDRSGKVIEDGDISDDTIQQWLEQNLPRLQEQGVYSA